MQTAGATIEFHVARESLCDLLRLHIKEIEMKRDTRTSLRICGFPEDFTGPMLKELLDCCGFRGCYDFVYVPIFLPGARSYGYGFVNCTSRAAVEAMWHLFHGKTAWTENASMSLKVQWSTNTQGLQSLVEKYRNCSIMHKSVPAECKPILLQNGEEVPFPEPTKKLEKPRHRNTMIPPCRFAIERLVALP